MPGNTNNVGVGVSVGVGVDVGVEVKVGIAVGGGVKVGDSVVNVGVRDGDGGAGKIVRHELRAGARARQMRRRRRVGLDKK